MKGGTAYDGEQRNLQGHGLYMLRPLVQSQPPGIPYKNRHIAASDRFDMVWGEDRLGRFHMVLQDSFLARGRHDHRGLAHLQRTMDEKNSQIRKR